MMWLESYQSFPNLQRVAVIFVPDTILSNTVTIGSQSFAQN
jgi:hypothetical protein